MSNRLAILAFALTLTLGLVAIPATAESNFTPFQLDWTEPAPESVVEESQSAGTPSPWRFFVSSSATYRSRLSPSSGEADAYPLGQQGILKGLSQEESTDAFVFILNVSRTLSRRVSVTAQGLLRERGQSPLNTLDLDRLYVQFQSDHWRLRGGSLPVAFGLRGELQDAEILSADEHAPVTGYPFSSFAPHELDLGASATFSLGDFSATLSAGEGPLKVSSIREGGEVVIKETPRDMIVGQVQWEAAFGVTFNVAAGQSRVREADVLATYRHATLGLHLLHENLDLYAECRGDYVPAEASWHGGGQFIEGCYLEAALILPSVWEGRLRPWLLWEFQYGGVEAGGALNPARFNNASQVAAGLNFSIFEYEKHGSLLLKGGHHWRIRDVYTDVSFEGNGSITLGFTPTEEEYSSVGFVWAVNF